jgi:hypothetical protein
MMTVTAILKNPSFCPKRKIMGIGERGSIIMPTFQQRLP